jgi:hypothetical protein
MTFLLFATIKVNNYINEGVDIKDRCFEDNPQSILLRLGSEPTRETETNADCGTDTAEEEFSLREDPSVRGGEETFDGERRLF